MSEIYKLVGTIVQKVLSKQGTIRSLCFADDVKYKKAVFGLVCETLKYNRIIEILLSSHPMVKKHFATQNKIGLAKVLIYMLIVSPKLHPDEKNKLKAGGKDIKLIKTATLSLQVQLQRMIQQKIKENEKLQLKEINERYGNSPLLLLPEEIRNPITIPRYVRINTIKMTLQEVINEFKNEGYTLVEYSPTVHTKQNTKHSPPISSPSTISNNNNINKKTNKNNDNEEHENKNDDEGGDDNDAEEEDDSKDEEEEEEEQRSDDQKIMWIDNDIPNLLCFPANTDLHDHRLLEAGCIILQDKASCMPAYVLLGDCKPSTQEVNDHHQNNSNYNENDQRSQTYYNDVLDACAAPGNKTTHLASIMWDHHHPPHTASQKKKHQTSSINERKTNRLYAVDKDKRRLDTMIKLTHKVGVTEELLTTINSSFLDLSPNDPRFASVTHFQVDPSCSGSGIVSRFDSLLESYNFPAMKEDEKRLESLSSFQMKVLDHAMSFPNVKRVVYSTCSIHSIENEEVVKATLLQHPNFSLVKALPLWHHRGLSSFGDIGDMCVRADPSSDYTNGFFVCCFEKTSSLSSPPLSENGNPHPDVIVDVDDGDVVGDNCGDDRAVCVDSPLVRKKKNTTSHPMKRKRKVLDALLAKKKLKLSSE